MGATPILDDPEIAPALSSTHLPTSEESKYELAYQRVNGIEMGSLARYHSGVPTVLQLPNHK